MEKPATHCFREGRLLIETARKYNRVVHHGTQTCSNPLLLYIREVFDSGILGKIMLARVWNIQMGQHNYTPAPDGQAPPGVDYDRWLGPAPVRPFNEKRFHGSWRMFRDYGNGELGDDGAHDLDLGRWGLGATSHPVRITAHGSNMTPLGYREYPDNVIVSFQCPDGRILTYEERVGFAYGVNGTDSSNAVYGTEGFLVFSRRGYLQVYLGRKEEPGPGMRGGGGKSKHMMNFLECVRTRKEPVVPAETAHMSCALVHLGEVAYRAGGVLEFDPKTETITNNREANNLLTKEYRQPWRI